MYTKNLITIVGIWVFIFCLHCGTSLGFAQQHQKPNKYRIVVFDFHVKNIPPVEESFFDMKRVAFSRSIENALSKKKSDKIGILERHLLSDVHFEVRYGNDNKWEFDQATIAKIKTKGGNAGLAGIISYSSGGDINLTTRLVNIATSEIIFSDERKVKFEEFRENSEKFANEISKSMITEILNQFPPAKKHTKTWLWIGGGAIAVGTLAAILLNDPPPSQPLPGLDTLWPPQDK